MKILLSILVLVAGLCMPCAESLATKAFVTDTFRISLRRGPSIENKILKFLSSGQPVEVLESNDGWSRVQPYVLQGQIALAGVVSSARCQELPR